VDEEPRLSRQKSIIRRKPKGRRKSKGREEEAKGREVAWGIFLCHLQLSLLPTSKSLQIASSL